jgi:hypothetical protein
VGRFKTFLAAVDYAGTSGTKLLTTFDIGTYRRCGCVWLALFGYATAFTARANRFAAFVESWIEVRIAEGAEIHLRVLVGDHGRNVNV